MVRDYDFWDELSVACTEVREAIEYDFTKEGIEALENRVIHILKCGGLIKDE